MMDTAGNGRLEAPSDERFLNDLGDATSSFDREQALRLCHEFRHLPLEQRGRLAGDVLKLLRQALFFEEMALVSEGLIEDGLDTAQTRLQYAQGLIDRGLEACAIPLLEAIDDAALAGQERGERMGLLGRAYKQLFVDSHATAGIRTMHLNRAIGAYWNGYLATNPNSMWLGINVVALLERARRDGIPVEGYAGPEAQELAKQVLQAAESQEDTWSRAAEAEALLALGRNDQSIEALRSYARADGIHPFHLASTLRQYIEIWRLDDASEPGDSMLSLLRGHLLRRKGGMTTVTPTEMNTAVSDPASLKAVFGTDFKTFEWYKKGLDRGRAVGRIETPTGTGTGFVVRGEDIRDYLAGQLFVLTSEHVMAGTPVSKVKVHFEAFHKTCQVDKVVLLAPLWGADAALLRVRDLPAPMPYCPLRRSFLKAGNGTRVYIIGYPKGNRLSYSFNDNILIYADRQELHYRTSAEPGNSGSPVFDEEWTVAGIHQMSEAVPRTDVVGQPYRARRAMGIRQVIMEMGDPEGHHKKRRRPRQPSTRAASA